MELTIKYMSLENEFGQNVHPGICPETKEKISIPSDTEERNNAILKKVIENYGYNFEILEDGHCIVSLERENENLCGIENSVISGGTFLLGQSTTNEKKTNKTKVQESFSLLVYKKIKLRIVMFFNCKKLIIGSILLNFRFFS